MVILGGSSVKSVPSCFQVNEGRGNPAAVHIMVTTSSTMEYCGKGSNCVMRGGPGWVLRMYVCT